MTEIHAPDSLKMIRETLCVAQTHVNLCVADTDRRQEHSDRLQRLIDNIDRQRPLRPDGEAIHCDRLPGASGGNVTVEMRMGMINDICTLTGKSSDDKLSMNEVINALSRKGWLIT